MKPAPALPIAAAASIEVGLNAAGDGAPITRVQLLPIGQVHLRDGRGPFLLPPEHASAVVEATRRKAGRTAIMIDYDHQSFYGAKDGVGGRAPAAGWIDPASLSVDATGIWGTVEWTPAAGQRLKAREYRYLSPLFSYDEKTKIVSSILNAGLTNTPAIEALAAVASVVPQDAGASLEDRFFPDKNPTQETTQMDISKIAAALGLADTATEEEVMAKIAELTASHADMTAAASAQAVAQTTLAAAATKLGLAKDASVDHIVAAAARVDPAKFVPVSALNALSAQLAELQGDRAEKIVAAAMEAGKVSPAMKGWADSLARKSLTEFNDWLAVAPVILEPGQALTAAAMQAGGDGLTDSERTVAKMLGRTPEQFLQAKKV